jgi:hypothetical protein
MAANRVGDLTVDELKALVRETMFDMLEEIAFRRIEDGLEFSDEVASELREYMAKRPEGEPAEKVMKELGLWEDD